MVDQLIQVIKKHSNWLRRPDSRLSFMSLGASTKVILFVFEDDERWPTLCAKTTRTYTAGEKIKANYHNLKLLASGVANTTLVEMFAKPLYLYDDGQLIFCLESVCPGVAFSTIDRDPGMVIEKYTAWQSHLASVTKQKFISELNFKLPRLLQHGDLTPDNVLVFGDRVYFIDYEHVGVSMLPGFDLFNFLLRLRQRAGSLRANCERYFPNYFQAIGVRVAPSDYESVLFNYYLEERRRKGGPTDASDKVIMNNFRVLMDQQ